MVWGKVRAEGDAARAKDAAVAESKKSLRFTRSSYAEVILVMMAVIAVRVPTRSRFGG